MPQHSLTERSLRAGDKAPQFTLKDDAGNAVTLSDFKGKTVVLYFYPKDDTPGCTKEACDFRDGFKKFQSKDTVILGVSKDGTASHKKFKEKFDLPFLLLSDETTKMMQDYGVWTEKSLYGRKFMGTVRTTLVIDARGVIRHVFGNVKVDGHIDEVLNCLQ